MNLRALRLFACLLLVPLGLMLPVGAFAVSLGDELILSRLGDPVEVEVEVLQWEDMDLERVQISAASREEYEVFKLTWLPVLEHLNFNLVGPDLDGNVRVLISSRDPLDEPFLELLLVLRWPGGSLRREYVLLFDPPGAPLAVASPADATRDEEAPAEVAAPAPALVTNVPQSPAAQQSPPASLAPTVPGETAIVEASVRVDAPSPVETAPMVDAPPQVDATPIVETSPPVAAVVDATPPVEAAPVVEAPPAVEAEAPAVEAPPPVAAAPVVAAPPPVAATPVVEAPSPVEATPVVEAPPPVEATPVVEAPPPVGTSRVVEAPPTVEAAPVDATPPQVAIASGPQTAAVEEAPAPAAPVPVDVRPEPVAASATRTAPVAEPLADAAPREPEPRPDARTQVAIDVETLAPPAAAAPVGTARRTYQVRSGDSLWNIARQFRPAGAGENLYQMLLGIHDLNRASFINGNISLLKANALLQMPTEADIAAIDAATAQAEFDRRWEAGTQRFDAAQRGEAIPLFVNDVPEDVPAAPVEPALPPGTEAPPAPVDDGGLIMVSSTNAALPLQLPSAEDDAPETTAEATDEDTGGALALQTNATDAAPAPESTAPDAEPVPQSTTADAEPLARQVDSVPADDSATVSTSDTNDRAVQVPAGASRAIVTTELETELAAMRARRETAEALARQLQDSLQRAEAERAAQTALLGPRNLPLAGGALALVLTLIAGIVFMLKLAGELRAVRVDAEVARVLPHGEPSPFERPRVASTRSEPSRTEPTWSEPAAEPYRTPAHRDATDAAQIEVVELEVPQGTNATEAVNAAGNPEDLFARMDDMLGAAKKSPQK